MIKLFLRCQVHNLSRQLGFQLGNGCVEVIEAFALEVFLHTDPPRWARAAVTSTPLTIANEFMDTLGHHPSVPHFLTEIVTAIIIHAAEFSKQRSTKIISARDIILHKAFFIQLYSLMHSSAEGSGSDE